jgi:hypothetical protein
MLSSMHLIPVGGDIGIQEKKLQTKGSILRKKLVILFLHRDHHIASAYHRHQLQTWLKMHSSMPPFQLRE